LLYFCIKTKIPFPLKILKVAQQLHSGVDTRHSWTNSSVCLI
jgi:hypothetical protein